MCIIPVIYTKEFREPAETNKYWKTEFLPRSKHSESRLQKPII